MVCNMANVDFSSFFTNLKSYSEEINQSKSNGNNAQNNGAGSVLNLCRQSNYGSALLRLLPDECGVPMKVLAKLFEIWETVEVKDEQGNVIHNDDGSVRHRSVPHTIVDPLNYNSKLLKLNPAQLQTLNTLINTINRYMDYVSKGIINTDETGLTIKFRKEISLFWAKVIALTDKSGKTIISDGQVKLCMHKSANFSRLFTDACTARSNIMRDSGAWMSKFMDDTVGQSSAITSISTDLGVGGQPGYSINITFAEGAPFEITQEDVSLCKDLNTQVMDVTTFDTDYFVSLNDRINKFIADADNKAKGNLGMTSAAQPIYQTIDPAQLNVATQVAAPTAQPAINNGPTPAEVMGQVPPVEQPMGAQMPPMGGFQIPTNSL